MVDNMSTSNINGNTDIINKITYYLRNGRTTQELLICIYNNLTDNQKMQTDLTELQTIIDTCKKLYETESR